MNEADKLKRLMDRVEGVLERMVPLTPVEIGSPVALVSVAADGVPRFGVVKTADVVRATSPVPPFWAAIAAYLVAWWRPNAPAPITAAFSGPDSGTRRRTNNGKPFEISGQS